MSSFKYIALLLVLPLLGGCRQAITRLSDRSIHGTALYSGLFRDSAGKPCSFFPDGSQALAGDSVTVYKTSFEEQYIEAAGTLAIASRNRSSRQLPVRYKSLNGYRQDLFLVRVRSACDTDAWVYFSVVYKPVVDKQVQEGFGTAYLGRSNPANGTIYFYRSLRFSYDDALGYRLHKRRRQRGLIFVADDLRGAAGEVSVSRIVVEEPNKFAGPNPYVFVISERFHDISRLRFIRVPNAP